MSDDDDPSWWKWLVVFASTWSLFLGGSMSYCSGVFHVAFLDHYQQDMVETAWLGSLFSCMFAVTGPLASLTVNLFSCRICVMSGSLLIMLGFTLSSFITNMRWLFLTYAILVGIGEGMVYSGSLVVLGFYFPRHASMATGVGMAGVAMATFVFPPLTQVLLDYFGLQGCFQLLGAFGFQTAVFGALMKPCDVELRVAKLNGSAKTLCQKISMSFVGNLDSFGDIFQPTFLLFLFSAFCFSIGNYITYLFLPDYFIQQGSKPQEAAFLLSVVGIGGTLSRTLSGFAASDSSIGPLLLYAGTYGVVAILDFFIAPLTVTLGGKMAYSMMFGLYASAGWVLLSPITLHIVGVRNLASAFGIVMFSCGLGILIGPPIAGLIVESRGNYQEGFFFAGSAFVITCGCGFLISLLWKQHTGDELEKTGEAERQSMIATDEKSAILDSITMVIAPPPETSHRQPVSLAPLQCLNDM